MKDIKKDVLRIINDVLKKEGIKAEKVFLFGSRAEGKYTDDSDWDFLVVVDRDLNQEEKKHLWHKIFHTIHKYFPYNSFDIIIKEKSQYEREKSVPNTMSNEVYLDGVKI